MALIVKDKPSPARTRDFTDSLYIVRNTRTAVLRPKYTIELFELKLDQTELLIIKYRWRRKRKKKRKKAFCLNEAIFLSEVENHSVMSLVNYDNYETYTVVWHAIYCTIGGALFGP